MERARAGEGPTLIEAKTYRYYNHWGAPGAKPGQLGAFGYDPLAITSFRPEREVRDWMQRDPVDICRNTLVNWGVMASLDRIDCPVLVIGADQDYTPQEFKQAYTAMIRGAYFAVSA